ncbi:MAG: DedA family protein [Cytophagales bacterium]|nr:DedA family protein [Bernardetiaceae bacterium]MDW8204536.1 DedA family protein [Cytophagales bacterium]
MEWFLETFKWFTDPVHIILYGGLLVIAAIVFAENGVFFALLLPGESLVFLTGVFCQMGLLAHSLSVVMLVVLLAAFSGHQFGYYFGKRSGRWLLRYQGGYLIKRKHIVLARAYYRKYGIWTILIGRYIPIVRTLAPIVAGSFGMKHSLFSFCNFLSTLFWVIPFLLLGYFTGALVPNAQQYLPLVFVGLVLAVLMPFIQPLWQGRINCLQLKTRHSNKQNCR